MIGLADTFGAMLMPTNRAAAWLRDSFFSLARFAPALRNYVLQMRFKPMPSYTNGVVLPGTSSATGRMLVQPEVETADGVRRKLDDVLGPWFAILGWRCDPLAHLSAEDRSYWHALGVKFVQVNRSRSGLSREGRVESAYGCECVEDVDNALAEWFSQHPGPIVLVRPDRYVAAQTDVVGLTDLAGRFQAFASPQLEQADVC